MSKDRQSKRQWQKALRRARLRRRRGMDDDEVGRLLGEDLVAIYEQQNED